MTTATCDIVLDGSIAPEYETTPHEFPCGREAKTQLTVKHFDPEGTWDQTLNLCAQHDEEFAIGEKFDLYSEVTARRAI